MENIQLYLGILVGLVTGIVLGWALLQKTIKSSFEIKESENKRDLLSISEKSKKLEEQLQEGRGALKKALTDLSELQNQKLVVEKNGTGLKARIKELETEIAKTNDSHGKVLEERDSLKLLAADSEKEANRLNKEIKTIQGKHFEMQTDCERVKSDFEKKNQELEGTKNELVIVTSKKNLAEEKIGTLENRLETLIKENAQVDSFKNRLLEYETRSKELENELKISREISGDLKQQNAVFEERVRSSEAQLKEKRVSFDKIFEEAEDLKKELSVECARRSSAEERMLLIPRLEAEIASLKNEISKVKTTSELLGKHERQLQEIKAIQGKMVDENSSLKQKTFASNILEIKGALEKAVEAYNKTVGLIDGRSLVQGGRRLEIEIQPSHEPDTSDFSDLKNTEEQFVQIDGTEPRNF
ncbi:MAG: hypothetical protein HQM08_27455 [Candidatus Riflebacteria bacterium]|nr:hypothetical protein [Candidatus Riflebacteria bacterium]